MILSDDKINHISHLILEGIKKERLAKLIDDEVIALREIKKIIFTELKMDDEIDAIVRKKLESYSRKIVEKSPEWDVLYQKFFKEELKKKRR
ncbi:MAG: DUF507 family protein [Nitrospirota bacterium]|jgi:hypothetical protein